MIIYLQVKERAKNIFNARYIIEIIDNLNFKKLMIISIKIN